MKNSKAENEDIVALIAKVVRQLLARKYRLATAESCTGGGVSALLTQFPGSSKWFDRGFVTYSNDAKSEMLGIASQLILSHGAVSQEVAEAMAQGACQYSKAHIALAITGIAGPGGGTPGKPVGTVWCAWAEQKNKDCHEITVSSRIFLFDGDREFIRKRSAYAALQGLQKLLFR